MKVTDQTIMEAVHADPGIAGSVNAVAEAWGLSNLRTEIIWDLVGLAFVAGMSMGVKHALEKAVAATVTKGNA